MSRKPLRSLEADDTFPTLDVANDPGLHVGARLRHARLMLNMRLKDVAEKASCSVSMLSKIENDRAIPSLTTLHRLCRALDLSISKLLNAEGAHPWTILREGGRTFIGHARSSGSEGVHAELLIPYTDGRLLEGFVVIIEPGGHSGGVLQHKGEEVGYVFEGELELTLKDQVFLLKQGDSFHFPSGLPHSYRNPGAKRVRAIWINTPPTF